MIEPRQLCHLVTAAEAGGAARAAERINARPSLVSKSVLLLGSRAGIALIECPTRGAGSASVSRHGSMPPPPMTMTIRARIVTRRTGMVLAAAAALLTSCGSPQDADADNFRAALQSWFDEHGECVNIGDMPAKIWVGAPSRSKARYEAMTAGGLLTSGSRREERPSIMGQYRSHDDYLVYRPTGEGAQVIREAADTFLGRNELCFARRNVIEVMSWTQPSEMMGLHVSQVRYRYRLDDIAPWAIMPAMRAAFPGMAKAVDTPRGEDKASLILTSEGWRNEKSLRR